MRGFSENPYLEPCSHGLEKFSRDQSRMKVLYWENKYFLGFISASIKWILLSLHISDSVPIPLKRERFILHRSITKETLLVEQITFSALSRQPFDGFP